MSTVAGLFDSTAEAQAAVEELVAAGWARNDVSIVARKEEDAGADHPHLALKDAEKGAVVGGLAGLFLGLSELFIPGVGIVLVGGWLAAALIGAGVGAAAGGTRRVACGSRNITRGGRPLRGGGAPGRILVTVKTDEERAGAAAAILQKRHALKIENQTA